MSLRTPRTLHDPQAGGITIIVTLMLLVLLTVAAMGMSRNALRELAISGTSRQGAMARNTADSGIEWATYWMYFDNAPNATGTALQLNTLKLKLLTNPTLGGLAYDPTTQNLYNTTVLSTPPADTTLPAVNSTTQGFTIGLTSMGKLAITGQSFGVGQGAYNTSMGQISAIPPDLWAVRSDSQITTGTFPFTTRYFHSKEAWISTQSSMAQ